MDEQLTEHNQQPPAQLYCKCCNRLANESDDFCSHCGFPLHGTEEEKNRFILHYINRKFDNEKARQSIKNARVALILVAVFTFLGGVIFGVADEDGNGKLLFIISTILAGGFGVLAWWSEYKPFAAVLIGTIMYVSLILLGVISEPESIIKGIIVKIVIIVILIQALIKSSKYRQEEDNG